MHDGKSDDDTMPTRLRLQNNPALETLASEMLSELRNDILPFWMSHAMDRLYGGYHGRISNNLEIDHNADKGGILHSRVLWTFAASYRLFGDKWYKESAEHAFRFLMDHFWDKEYGGIYWMTDFRGRVVNDRKQAYNMAFAIYGLSEYFRAAGDVVALERAKDIFALLEKHFRDERYGGYIEALGRDYSQVSDFRLSEKEKNDIKTMNTHLHMLEAYTNLLRVWDCDPLRRAHESLLNDILDHIVDRENDRFRLFFDDAWSSSSDMVSFGHDIEGSWLLCEAADIRGDEHLMRRVEDIAVRMAYQVLEEGYDPERGGIFNEANDGEIDTDKHWWPQAEAVVGFINAYSITGDESFLDAACRTWSFIRNYIIDKKYGEWFWRCDITGNPYWGEPKVEPWKCPYHNGRACMEVFERAALLRN
jgi:mannobiose 2-epimerase